MTLTTTLLRDAPPGRHICQFHRTSESLGHAVVAYVRAGIEAGDGVVVVATPARRDAVAAAVPGHAAARGQLVSVDAAGLLARFMTGDGPDAARFRGAVEPVLDGIVGAGFRRLRVYGEMVDLLWHDGRPDAAVRLEEMWNDLSVRRPFCLFCGYRCDGFDAGLYARPLDAVARAHSDVASTDDDAHVQAAVDAATTEILGLPLSTALTYFGVGGSGSEHRLPSGQRTLLWLRRNMPSSFGKIIARARAHYDMQATA